MKTGFLLLAIVAFAAAMIAVVACAIMLKYFKREKGRRVYAVEEIHEPVHSNYRYVYPENLRPAVLHEPDEDQCEELLHSLNEYFEKEKIYLKSNVKITDVAKHLGTNKAYLSRAVNKFYGMNYSQMVNWFRVRHATAIVAKNPDITMDELCHKSGFQSMTTFTSAFSRYTGNTPAEWCKHYRRGNEVPPPVFVMNKPFLSDVDKKDSGEENVG